VQSIEGVIAGSRISCDIVCSPGISLKFAGSQHFSGQIASQLFLQDNPRLGIGGQVVIEQVNPNACAEQVLLPPHLHRL
jgi:hypothetical protein